MTKTLTVATEVQKHVFTSVLLAEISNGFWKNVRPADHADAWRGITVRVSETDLGVIGFEVPRNYNFVNPDFLHRSEVKMLEAAKAVDPEITVKKLRKQLIMLSRTVGGRIKQVGGPITKLERGQSRKLQASTEKIVTTTPKTTVRKVPVNFVDPTTLASTETLAPKRQQAA